MSKTFTLDDVSRHDSKDDLFMVIHGKVYDSTSFVDEHPGGGYLLVEVAGQDATEAFEDSGHSEEARKILNGLLVGDVSADDLKSKDIQHGISTPSKGRSGLSIYVLLFVIIAVALLVNQLNRN